jgi:thiamine-phosphate pyrophosphorylase
VRLVQLREKTAGDRERLSVAEACVGLASATGARLVVNDRADLAVLASADGVHLGEDDLPAELAREIVGPRLLIGVSTHSVSACRRALEEEAPDYVALGPVFATRSKSSRHEALGLSAIREAARDHRKPLVVIGGIEAQHVGDCLSAGADCVAMISGLLDGDVRANVERALDSAHRAGFPT